MRIGPYAIDTPVVLAPMAGITDAPFRQLCRHFGAGLTTAEMLTSDTRLWQSRKSLLRRAINNESGIRAAQIVGAVPSNMADAAKRAVDDGARIIDINMGCPAKNVCQRAAGSALLRDEPLVEAILAAVVGAVAVPVTLKIRTGWSRQERNAVRIARIAEDTGIQALTVHGRTREDRFSGEAEYETIARIREIVRLPLIANGDIDSPRKARQVLARTGADAVMIGRAALGRPWIFRDVAAYLASGSELPAPGIEEVVTIAGIHFEYLYQHYGPEHGVRIARKHAGWYFGHRPDWNRTAFNEAITPEAQRSLIEAFAAAALVRASNHPDRESIAA